MMQFVIDISCMLQLTSGTELAEVKRRVGLLKRVCRQRTQGAWKEWRASMEQHKATWLANHLTLLHQDHSFLHSGLTQVQQLQQQAHQLQNDLREDMTKRREQHQVDTALGLCTRALYTVPDPAQGPGKTGL